MLRKPEVFLNTHGGTLIISVSGDGIPVGDKAHKFPNDNHMSLHLVNIVKARLGARAMHLLFALTIDDPDHSVAETRFLTTGYSNRQRLIIVAHTDRDDGIRLINARNVTATEPNVYEEESR